MSLLGVPFDNVTIGEAVARIDRMIATHQPHYVATANVDFLMQAHGDVELRRILLEADLLLCDGTPLVWASHLLGNPLHERVAGSDLAPSLIRHAAVKGHRIFFLGAAPGVAAEAATRLRAEFPTLNIVGDYAPQYAELLAMDHPEIARRIREARPDILLVSFGCPKQEKWIAMHYRSLGVPVSIGVGATLDFLAGRVRRAPAWMRRSGTEWIFRLLQEPRRLYRRYVRDLAFFFPTLARQWWRLTRHGSHTTAPTHLRISHGWCRIEPGENLTLSTLNSAAAFWNAPPSGAKHCLIDLTAVRWIDASGIAVLVRWKKALQQQGGRLVLLAPSASVRRVLHTLRLDDYFSIAGNEAEVTPHPVAGDSAPLVLHDSATRSLAWCGEIVAANVEDVWQMTTQHLKTYADRRAALVVVDLSRLRFIDSSGASLMLRLKKWAQQFPAQVLFTHAQPNVLNVLRLTRLDRLLLEGAQ